MSWQKVTDLGGAGKSMAGIYTYTSRTIGNANYYTIYMDYGGAATNRETQFDLSNVTLNNSIYYYRVKLTGKGSFINSGKTMDVDGEHAFLITSKLTSYEIKVAKVGDSLTAELERIAKSEISIISKTIVNNTGRTYTDEHGRGYYCTTTIEYVLIKDKYGKVDLLIPKASFAFESKRTGPTDKQGFSFDTLVLQSAKVGNINSNVDREEFFSSPTSGDYGSGSVFNIAILNIENAIQNDKISVRFDIGLPAGTYTTVVPIWDVYLDVSFNVNPTITLTTTNNRTLYENDVLSLIGNAKDTDNGDVVTVRYRIDGGTTRAITTAISTGANIPYSKNLTFKNKKLYDGDNAVTSDLAESTPHTIEVWADDDKGGSSAKETRTFQVVHNRPAALTINEVTGTNDLINMDKIEVSGSITDPDGNKVKVEYKVNNSSFIEVYDDYDGDFNFDLPIADLKDGNNTVTIRAEDSYGAKSTKTLSINKEFSSTELKKSVARYKLNPPNGYAKGVMLWIEREVGDLDVSVDISMTNDNTENFVPMTKTLTAYVRDGIEEDEFTFEADEDKSNIILQITITREDTASNKGIVLISGVLS